MRKLALGLALSLLVAGCGDTAAPAPAATNPPVTSTTAAQGSGAPVATEAPAAAFPVTIAHSTGEVTLEDRPRAIVSLSPTATEILFALGADEQVKAVDSQSNFPPDAPITDLSAFEPSVESIAALEPDLVVLTFDPGDIESGLTALGIPVMVQFSALSLADTYAQIEQLGAASGHAGAAADLVGGIKDTIAEIADSATDPAEPLTYYHELDDTLYSVTSSTFVGELYSVLGLENIADPADAAGFGFPQLSAEFILEADPDLIFLADTKCCDQTAAALVDRPGWDQLSAVKKGSVVELDDDVASRWGPRIIEFLETIVAAVEKFEGDQND